MTKLFKIALAFLLPLIIGCQENSITDPVLTMSEDNQVQKKLDPQTFHNYIILDGMLTDPYPVINSYYLIKGRIDYEFNLVLTDPIPPLPQAYTAIHLLITAELSNFCSVCIPPAAEIIAGSVQEDLNLNLIISGSFSILEKSFLIEGREDGMMLNCRFFVYAGGLKLSAMWLALPVKFNVATNNQ